MMQKQVKQVNPVPDADGAIPYLFIKGASDAIGFYQRVLGAEQTSRLNGPDGSVMHAELKVGRARFMLTEEKPERQCLSPLALGGSPSMTVVYVPDCDAVVERAVKAGAKLGMPVQDQFWGDRSGSFIDPFGHGWMISTHKEDPTPEEIERRFKKMVAEGPGC